MVRQFTAEQLIRKRETTAAWRIKNPDRQEVYWTASNKKRSLLRVKKVMPTMRERIEASSIPEPNSGCWLWLAGITGGFGGYNSYGTISFEGKQWKAHRASYKAFKGAIPVGMEICHSCDMPICVNPDHLFIGTHLENMRDRDRKGRRQAPRGARIGTAKLSENKVREIKLILLSGIETQIEIADRFGVDQTTISLIKNGKLWSHIGDGG